MTKRDEQIIYRESDGTLVVTDGRGRCDRPILYRHNGKIAWEHPGWFTKKTRGRAERKLRKGVK